jgi:TolB-like protein
MPPFPHVPEKGGFLHGVKFLAEVLWWLLTAAWTVFVRLPKWARVVVTVWLILSLFSPTCTRSSDSPPSPRSPHPTSAKPGEGSKKVRQAVERAAQSARESGFTLEKGDLAKIASEIAHVFRDGATDGSVVGKPLVVVPFSRPNDETPAGKFAHSVFLSLYGRLSLERRSEVSVVPPVRGEPGPTALLARAAALGASFVLAADTVSASDAAATLTVNLFSAAEGRAVWCESFALNGADESAVAEKIATQVLERIPRKEPRRPKAP